MSIEELRNSQETCREIYLKEQFFQFVLSGLKTLELRVAFQSFAKISEGDYINFKSGGGQSVKVRINNVRRYKNLHEVLQFEEISKLAPTMTKEQIEKLAPALFSEADILKNGLILLDFEKVQ